ncbi:MAG: type II toxin-antitoxin system VapC family toxin [Spirochaetaceae bacterium]|jgi:predicted nucleic acid-binding protein|nr:type II toxin-antitoxin system VapC family toxin [Spirochaetaceae bacterium]
MINILDCSFCAALFLPHEKSALVKALFAKFADDDELAVPVQFWDEMTGLLLSALARNRLKHADALEINRLLSMYHLTTEVSFAGDYTGQLLDLAGLYGLNAGEAAYLELAIRKKGKLGTLSGKLKAACIKAGIETLL